MERPPEVVHNKNTPVSLPGAARAMNRNLHFFFAAGRKVALPNLSGNDLRIKLTRVLHLSVNNNL
jgi:ribosome maturation factor RimP